MPEQIDGGAQPLILTAPEPGETVRVELQPHQTVHLHFRMNIAKLKIIRGALHMTLPNGGLIILADFKAQVATGVSPLLVFHHGCAIAGTVLLALLKRP